MASASSSACCIPGHSDDRRARNPSPPWPGSVERPAVEWKRAGTPPADQLTRSAPGRVRHDVGRRVEQVHLIKPVAVRCAHGTGGRPPPRPIARLRVPDAAGSMLVGRAEFPIGADQGINGARMIAACRPAAVRRRPPVPAQPHSRSTASVRGSKPRSANVLWRDGVGQAGQGDEGDVADAGKAGRRCCRGQGASDAQRDVAAGNHHRHRRELITLLGVRQSAQRSVVQRRLPIRALRMIWMVTGSMRIRRQPDAGGSSS